MIKKSMIYSVLVHETENKIINSVNSKQNWNENYFTNTRQSSKWICVYLTKLKSERKIINTRWRNKYTSQDAVTTSSRTLLQICRRVSGWQIFKKQVSISEATGKNEVTVSDCLCYFGVLWLNNSADRVRFFGVRSMIRDRYLIT